MTKNKKTKDTKQSGFSFSAENEKKAKKTIAKYPKGRQASAVKFLLDLAQRQNDNYLTKESMDYVANFLDMAPIRVYEVATFYSMFNTKPVGENLIQICRTTPCWLRGSDKLVKKYKEMLGLEKGEVSNDGKFSMVEVECLGACVNAPIVQINDDFYEDLTEEQFEQIIESLSKGKKIQHGSQIGRQCSAPHPGLTTLKEGDK